MPANARFPSLLLCLIVLHVGVVTANVRGEDEPKPGTSPGIAGRSMAAFPGFHWDRVPLNIHFGKFGAMSDEEIAFIATHSEFVVLEKSHGVEVFGSTEKGIIETAKRIKERNPRAKVLFYFNAFVNWQGYDAFQTYRPEWTLRDPQGKIVQHPSGTDRPDPSNREFQRWWTEIVSSAVKQGKLDGVFADALPQARSPALARVIGREKQAAVIAGLREMLAMTKSALGPNKIVLANGIRAGQHLEFLDWEGIDGVMIEHFDAFESTSPEDLKADLDSMTLAAQKGKFVVLKGWPTFNYTQKEVHQRTREENLRIAREQITFPLACFLIAAQPGCHFCYSWGYREADGGLDSYAELDRRLGPPLAEAQWEGLSATRHFTHASVWIDLVAKTARIDWK